eukprot:g3687.t1
MPKVLARGVNAVAKSAKSHRRYNKKGQLRFPKKAKADKAVAGEAKVGKYYAPDDVTVRKKRNHKPKSAKLRASITTGTVLILLAGRHRGKRVVFLKQMPSGLLLVTGPFKTNGVPVRRVNQAYVIATSTKVEGIEAAVAAVNGKDDSYFKRSAQPVDDKEQEFLDAGKVPAVSIADDRKALQTAVDNVVSAAVAKVDKLNDYLHARFSLSKGDAPHEMVF